MTTTSATQTTTMAECSCPWSISDEEHEWLTTVEQRGLAGFVELLDAMDLRAGSHHEAGNLTWPDLPAFIAMHNWDNPVMMVRLGRVIDKFVRAEYQVRSDAS